jgi:hypothetical protein
MIGAPPTGVSMPPSQHGADDSQAGPQAGSHAGAQAGAGAAHGAAAGDPHERNSMNDGRRQLLLPKQLLQPGAAARLATTSARHIARVMTGFSSTNRWGKRAWASHAASLTTPLEPYLMIPARPADGPPFSRGRGAVVRGPTVVPVIAARSGCDDCKR